MTPPARLGVATVGHVLQLDVSLVPMPAMQPRLPVPFTCLLLQGAVGPAPFLIHAWGLMAVAVRSSARYGRHVMTRG